MNKIFGLRAFNDNYIWAIHGLDNNHIVVVDPGDATPVLSYLEQNNLTLDAILLTHHHHDHTGGVRELLNHFPNIAVYGSLKDKVPGITHFVKEGDSVTLNNQKITLQVLEIPGHTLGHIAYYDNTMLFCGDTLFSVGCGKIFEGTAEQMYQSLEKLKQLPSGVNLYCGHEYTLSNIKFAKTVDPNNKALALRYEDAVSLVNDHKPSLPVTLASELKTNPFLRADDENVQLAVENYWDKKWQNPTKVFEYLRLWKNEFS